MMACPLVCDIAQKVKGEVKVLQQLQNLTNFPEVIQLRPVDMEASST